MKTHGNVDLRSDVFSFGVTLYVLVHGSLPTTATLKPQTIFDAIITKCMHDEKNERYESFIELKNEFSDIQCSILNKLEWSERIYIYFFFIVFFTLVGTLLLSITV